MKLNKKERDLQSDFAVFQDNSNKANPYQKNENILSGVIVIFKFEC